MTVHQTLAASFEPRDTVQSTVNSLGLQNLFYSLPTPHRARLVLFMPSCIIHLTWRVQESYSGALL